DSATHFKRLRERRGLSLYRLAQLAGLSKQGVINLEEPGADPKLSTLDKLAEALGVKPWELLPGWNGQSTAVDAEPDGREDAQASTPVDRRAREEKRRQRAAAKWLRDLEWQVPQEERG